jgi:hypothetical protein
VYILYRVYPEYGDAAESQVPLAVFSNERLAAVTVDLFVSREGCREYLRGVK